MKHQECICCISLALALGAYQQAPAGKRPRHPRALALASIASGHEFTSQSSFFKSFSGTSLMFGNDGGREEKQSEAKINRQLDVNQPHLDRIYCSPARRLAHVNSRN